MCPAKLAGDSRHARSHPTGVSSRGRERASVPADPQPETRLLGGVGRLGARRHGLVHLRAGARAGDARAPAALRDRGHGRPPRVLRQPPLRRLSPRLGLRLPLGSAGGPLRPRAHPVAHDPLLLALHLPRLPGGPGVATRALPLSRRTGDRRRVDAGRHPRRRGMAGAPAGAGRRLDAHRLLLRDVPGGGPELPRWSAVRVAGHVRPGRRPGAPRGLHPPRCQGARALEAGRGPARPQGKPSSPSSAPRTGSGRWSTPSCCWSR